MSQALSDLRTKYPSLLQTVEQVGVFASEKQVHQLTGEIQKLLDLGEGVISGADLVSFFENFVAKYGPRMNPVELVRIVAKCTSPEDVNRQSGLALLEKFSSEIDKSKDASILKRVHRARMYLHKAPVDLSAVRTEVDQTAKLMNDPIWSHTVSGAVRADYHYVAAEMYLSMGSNDIEFYSNLVSFLKYKPLSSISQTLLDKVTKQVAIIALINPDINDFGDLLSLPAFNESSSMHASQWLIDFLRAVHFGDFDLFQSAITSHQHILSRESQLLSQIESSLKQKLSMIALAELATSVNSSSSKTVSFEEIACACRVPLNQVEHLVMTTMGTGLVTGVIDEVESSVLISSVRPRMLDPARVKLLQGRISGWAERASELLNGMREIVTPELLVE